MKTGTVAVGYLHPGYWADCFGESLSQLYLVDAFGSRRLVPHGKKLAQRVHAGGVVDGRNAIARMFLDNTECEWLFMVDSDMGFGPDTVDRLIASADPETRPVVGALCFSLRKDTPGEFHGQKYVVVPTCFEYVDTDTEVGFRSILDYPADTMLQVGGTGAACLIVHRSALERVRGRFGDTWFNPATHPGGTKFSEDLSFCVRLAACDIPVWVNTSIRTTHDKGGLFLDEDEYHRSRLLHEAMGDTKEVAV